MSLIMEATFASGDLCAPFPRGDGVDSPEVLNGTVELISTTRWDNTTGYVARITPPSGLYTQCWLLCSRGVNYLDHQFYIKRNTLALTGTSFRLFRAGGTDSTGVIASILLGLDGTGYYLQHCLYNGTNQNTTAASGTKTYLSSSSAWYKVRHLWYPNYAKMWVDDVDKGAITCTGNNDWLDGFGLGYNGATSSPGCSGSFYLSDWKARNDSYGL